jgi:circadian clock protein KaiC
VRKFLFFIFDETVSTMQQRAAQLGMDLQPHIDSGVVCLQQIDPAEVAPGQLVDQIRRSVLERGVRMVVIDSINGYINAMPEERYLNLQLHELLVFLGQQGVFSIMVLSQQGLIGSMQAVVDLTYLADTVVLLRYYEVSGALKKAISVIKKRSGEHERTIREFNLSADGIQLGEPLAEFHGVLTGVPLLETRRDKTSAP